VSRPVAAEHTSAPEIIAGYPVHPAALRVPEASPEDYARLKEDIRKNGLREQIVLAYDEHDELVILDGRTRARICEELGIKVTASPTYRFGETDTARRASSMEQFDPVAYVLSMNVHRRHLSTDQIDQLIAGYVQATEAEIEADQEAAKDARRAGLKRGKARGVSETPRGRTATKIAKKIGVPESAVKRVLKVKKVAPEKLADVAAGRTSAAKVLKAIYQPVEETAEHEEKMHSEFKEKRAAERAMMRLLIGVGYKQVAPKFHPDTGGSTEAMIVLCAARDLLTRFAEKWS
jgi:ParB-like chromosome segregation protein Spo0J